jgi:putative RNase toxin 16 of polymorphic toxin system
MQISKSLWANIVIVVGTAVTVLAAGGSKRTAEVCADDSECARGHCHTKQDGSKVCVDCSASRISDLRGQIQRFCKDEDRTCRGIPRSEEVPEEYFSLRINNGDRCIDARKNENSECWNGGDDGHKQAVDEAERSRKICHDELDTRRGNGGIYTCSDSTYASEAAEADGRCSAYGRGCADYAKDDKVVDCAVLDDAMRAADKCVSAVERLDSDCLPKLSSRRERQFGDAKRAYDYCKDVIAHKTSNKLCK